LIGGEDHGHWEFGCGIPDRLYTQCFDEYEEVCDPDCHNVPIWQTYGFDGMRLKEDSVEPMYWINIPVGYKDNDTIDGSRQLANGQWEFDEDIHWEWTYRRTLIATFEFYNLPTDLSGVEAPFRLRWYEDDGTSWDDNYDWVLDIGAYVEGCLQTPWPPNTPHALGHELRDLHEVGGPGNFYVSYDVMCLWW
jgi:hypothetical protein